MIWFFILGFTAITCLCILAVSNLLDDAKTHKLEIEHPILWAIVAAIIGLLSFVVMLACCLAKMAELL
jgi:hypothetical protein|nr:MAG TPA: hypothetical protein [Caudoviricetes sp.]